MVTPPKQPWMRSKEAYVDEVARRSDAGYRHYQSWRSVPAKTITQRDISSYLLFERAHEAATREALASKGYDETLWEVNYASACTDDARQSADERSEAVYVRWSLERDVLVQKAKADAEASKARFLS